MYGVRLWGVACPDIAITDVTGTPFSTISVMAVRRKSINHNVSGKPAAFIMSRPMLLMVSML